MKCALYVHIPVCLKKCDYCDFFSVPACDFPLAVSGERPYQALINTLIYEATYYASVLDCAEWDTIYIGGGSPSLLQPEDIRELGKKLTRHQPAKAPLSREWSIEANPEDITREWLEACQEAGINRLSLGIQSMQDPVLQNIGRRGNRTLSLQALELVKRHWSGRLSMDLITGLPGQTKEMLISDLTEVHTYHPDHISLYSLTVEEGTPLEQKIAASQLKGLPDTDEAADVWIAGKDWLMKNGYDQYEVSNFSLPDSQCLHNLTYWNLDSYVGIGPGATGTIVQDQRALRYTNTRDIQAWLTHPESGRETEHIDRNDFMKETLMMAMRLTTGLSKKRFKDRFGQDILDVAGNTVRTWQARGLLSVDADHIALTEEGLMLLNRFLVDCLEEMCQK